ncbi:DUF1800 family protein [Ideonella sp.]|uniref:DUF1800 family protein n=1 Tax=Ideonella sp. TaxID=1929293 RepID=UPI0037C0928E
MQGRRWVLAVLVGLTACGGGGESAAPVPPPVPPSSLSRADAFRLAEQATFGPTESLLTSMTQQSAAAWVKGQMSTNGSRYTLGQGDAIHRDTSGKDFCSLPAYAGPNCWRDWFSTQPLAWDFYRNATTQPDQLRQRVALALQQILVINNQEVDGTYGFRLYYNKLLDQAFGNYREVLRQVTLSPVMGEFLNNVNNDKAAPNENFGRELLQLFSIGTCELNLDGSLKGGACQASYNNEQVRAYAYALTGWTYPAGGQSAKTCWPKGANCRYLGGEMVPLPRLHDEAARTLLSGVAVPAGSTAPQALEKVLDSLMQHPNMPPFIGRQLILHLVSSNPSPAYVQRVAQAFASGSFTAQGQSFGAGQRGDLAATVAAVLLDVEARGDTPSAAQGGKLREPALYFAGVIRALNGQTDGNDFTWWWGEGLQQHLFRPPSVFNFYPPDFPVAGTTLRGPAFGIHNANTGMQRLNFLTYLLFWNGSAPDSTVPGATGTRINTTAFEPDAGQSTVLVDRLAVLCCGARLSAAARAEVVRAVDSIAADAQRNPGWARDRVLQAAFLLWASPAHQVHQ